MDLWLNLALGAIGIASTLVAYYFNPKRMMYAELDGIAKKWEALNVKRDEALAKNDSDSLTIINASIDILRARQTVLLHRGITDSRR